MKKSITLLILILSSLFGSAQTVTTISTADSTKFKRSTGTTNAEVIIENGTRNITGGFLWNRWNGRTQFRVPVVSDITGLQDSLNAKLRLTGGTLTGTLNATSVSLSGNINLQETTSTTGIINQNGIAGAGSKRLLHSFSSSTSASTNIFLGYEAGNFTMSSSAIYNSGLGNLSLVSLTNGNENTALGYAAGADLTTGSDNTFVGRSAGSGITTGSGNTIIGRQTTTLPASTTNNIILYNGTGIMGRFDGTNWELVNNLTLTGLGAGGNKLIAANNSGTLYGILVGTGLTFDGTTISATGTGSISGSGTNGYIPVFTGTSSIGNSLLQQSGTTLTSNGTTNIFYGIVNASATNTPLIVNSTNSNGGKIGFQDNGTVRGYIGATSTNSFETYSSAGTLQLSINNSSGALIVNTSGVPLNANSTNSNTYKVSLQDNGTVRGYLGSDGTNAFIVGNNTAGSQLMTISNSTGAVTAGAFYESSDKRLKSLIDEDFKYSKIYGIKAKYYVKDGVKELGYFAQDVQKALPSAVIKGGDGYLDLSYRQVHTAKISYLENEVKNLKKLIKKQR